MVAVKYIVQLFNEMQWFLFEWDRLTLSLHWTHFGSGLVLWQKLTARNLHEGYGTHQTQTCY